MSESLNSCPYFYQTYAGSIYITKPRGLHVSGISFIGAASRFVRFISVIFLLNPAVAVTIWNAFQREHEGNILFVLNFATEQLWPFYIAEHTRPRLR